MFSLVTTLGASEAMKRELVPLAAAFAVAELFYKFHSFALECGAFLVTWIAFSALWSLVRRPASA
jgi:hypothetical protein